MSRHDAPLFLWLKPLKRPKMRTQAQLKVRVSRTVRSLSVCCGRPLMRAACSLQIMHLRKYIAQKLRTVGPEEVELLCRGAPVGPEYSLEFIRRMFWNDASTTMVLEFRRQLV